MVKMTDNVVHEWTRKQLIKTSNNITSKLIISLQSSRNFLSCFIFVKTLKLGFSMSEWVGYRILYSAFKGFMFMWVSSRDYKILVRENRLLQTAAHFYHFLMYSFESLAGVIQNNDISVLF